MVGKGRGRGVEGQEIGKQEGGSEGWDADERS